MLRRRLASLLVLAGCASVGCSASVDAAEPSASRSSAVPVVLTTFTVLADMVQVVGGPQVQVESLLEVGREVHGYEPTPADLRRAAGADLLIANGLGLEGWLDGLLAPLDLPRVTLTDRIEPILVRSGEYEGLANPHAWMSPVVGQQYVEAIADALATLAPRHSRLFAERAEAYSVTLDELHDQTVERLATVPTSARVLVTCEGAFSYLARDAGLEEVYLWAVNADRQGTPRQVADAITTVRDRGVPAVFCESTVSSTGQEQVARESGATFGGVLYVDSLSEADGPVPTYLDLLRHDVEVIVAGLTRSQEVVG
ncbi:metal ABC transporter substrate-binding protein [Actinotalea sp. K2]|uniref:metal ABC transporter substrate-binding protein n=1 Tax=Actinotalea sp. K2 TaxID=2939438 RepID=UPI0020173BCC|nr:metal ABC transporter substrate-binding protein [Actinotalea sp. K2]MCL3860571.1 metal ABC transporter substrate-binding protein [Actinotalea sp. K2]